MTSSLKESMSASSMLIRVALCVAPVWAAAPPQFEKEILPLLEAKCAKCHTGAEAQGGCPKARREDAEEAGEDTGKEIGKETRQEAGEEAPGVKTTQTKNPPEGGFFVLRVRGRLKS